jgi:hypothetical protein
MQNCLPKGVVLHEKYQKILTHNLVELTSNKEAAFVQQLKNLKAISELEVDNVEKELMQPLRAVKLEN